MGDLEAPNFSSTSENFHLPEAVIPHLDILGRR